MLSPDDPRIHWVLTASHGNVPLRKAANATGFESVRKRRSKFQGWVFEEGTQRFLGCHETAEEAALEVYLETRPETTLRSPEPGHSAKSKRKRAQPRSHAPLSHPATLSDDIVRTLSSRRYEDYEAYMLARRSRPRLAQQGKRPAGLRTDADRRSARADAFCRTGWSRATCRACDAAAGIVRVAADVSLRLAALRWPPTLNPGVS